jgi:hypothetical protein
VDSLGFDRLESGSEYPLFLESCLLALMDIYDGTQLIKFEPNYIRADLLSLLGIFKICLFRTFPWMALMKFDFFGS